MEEQETAAGGCRARVKQEINVMELLPLKTVLFLTTVQDTTYNGVVQTKTVQEGEREMMIA